MTPTRTPTPTLTLRRCNASDPSSRNATCNGRGDCVHDQCACDIPYLGFNCSEAIGCNYWDDDTLAWSDAGCSSTGVTEVNGCAAPARGVGTARRLTEASSGEVPAVPAVDPNVACAYALRCECTHLTDFAGTPCSLTPEAEPGRESPP